MTIYDLAMAAVLVLGMIRGAWRGFTWQMASICSLVLGYTAARTASGQVAGYLPGEPEVQRAMAMALIYMAVSGGIFGVAWLIRGSLKRMKFEAYDRHLGMLLGGMEGAGVGLLVTLLLVSMAPATRTPIFASPTGHVVGAIMSHVGPILPSEVRKVLEPVWDRESHPGDDMATATQEANSPTAESAVAIATSAPVASESKATSPAPTASAKPTGPAVVAEDFPSLEPIEETPAPATAAVPAPAPPSPPDKPVNIRQAARDSARQTTSGLKDLANQARKEIEQTVAETLDTSPEGDAKAATLSELVAKDRQRIEQTVQNIKGAKQKVNALAKQRTGQVKQQAGQARQQLNQVLADSIDKGQQKLEKAVGDAIDEQLQRLGGLEPAPASTPPPVKAPR